MCRTVQPKKKTPDQRKFTGGSEVRTPSCTVRGQVDSLIELKFHKLGSTVKKIKSMKKENLFYKIVA